jgi:hypothetical protein
MSYLLIGDIAGQYKALQALISKAPSHLYPYSLGDMIDKGLESKSVISFFKNNGKALLGNHEHLMLDYFKFKDTEAYLANKVWDSDKEKKDFFKKTFFYDNYLTDPSMIGDLEHIWLYNRGQTTLDSYSNSPSLNSHLEWISKLKPYDTLNHSPKEVLISHAPWLYPYSLEYCSDLGPGFLYDPFGGRSDHSFIWNRYVYKKPREYLNIFGHNASSSAKIYSDKYPQGIKAENLPTNKILEADLGDIFSICLDSSSGKILTGLDLETMTLYTQEYL